MNINNNMYIDDKDGRSYKRIAPSRKQSENYMSIVNVVVKEALGVKHDKANGQNGGAVQDADGRAGKLQ